MNNFNYSIGEIVSLLFYESVFKKHFDYYRKMIKIYIKIILIYFLFLGCSSKLEVEDNSHLIDIKEYKSPYLTESIENDMEQLIRFESIAKEIKDANERLEFYLAVAQNFNQKTIQLKDHFTNKNLLIQKTISRQEKKFGYRTRSSILNRFRKIKEFKGIILNDETIIDREIMKSSYLQAKQLRLQYVKLFRWSKRQLKDKKNYLQELKISGPPVIFYSDYNEYIDDYKLPIEISKYLSKEPFKDSNKNKEYDVAEVFIDCDDALSICEDDCDWEPSYGNGKYDEGEAYYDSNLNNQYDFEEEYEDINGNNIYDAQPKNDINILLSYKKLAKNIKDPFEKSKFYSAVSEALSIKTKGLEIDFNYKINKMKNLIEFYENEMGYEKFETDIVPPIDEVLVYKPLTISKDNIDNKLFLKQTQVVVSQYVKSKKYYKGKIKEYKKVLKILEKDYDHRRMNFEVFDYISIIDSYEYTSNYLSDSLRYNIDLLLESDIENTIYKKSKDKCNISTDKDQFIQGFYYRALGEALSLYIDDLERQFQDLSTIYLNTFENYERKLNYQSTFTFLSAKPINNYNYKTYLLDLKDHRSIYQKYYDQVDSLKEKYISLKAFYDEREKEYKDYLRILKYDDARYKSIKELTNIVSDSLLVNGIYTSPYYNNDMLNNEKLLLKYRKSAKEIYDPILRAEYYRNITETFYLAINQNIQNFIDNQNVYRKRIKEYENELGESYRKVKKRRPRYREEYEPIRITQSTVKMKLHEMQSSIMKKQYIKLNKRLDKYTNQYSDYLAFLDSISLDRNNQFKEKQNQMIAGLLSQEIKSKRKIIKTKYYQNEINFLQNIPIADKQNFKRNYIEVGWDRFSNVSEIKWFNKKNELKRKEYIYNKFNDLIKTVETQNDNLINLTIYKLESRGEDFLDYSFDIDLNFAETMIEQKFIDKDKLVKFNDESYVEVIWNEKLNISEIAWFDKNDVELKRNIYDNDNNLINTIEGDQILNNTIETDLSLAQIKFGDEEYIQKYKNEIYINRKTVFDKMNSKSLAGQVAGVLDINYDSNGNKSNAIWYIGNREEQIKEIIFPSNISLEQ